MSGPVDYDPILADLERRRDEIDQAIATIRSLRNMPVPTEGSPGISKVPRTNGTGSVNLERHQLVGMALPEAIRTYLGAVKQSKTAVQISAGLLEYGWTTTSRTPGNSVRTALARMKEDGDVVQVGGKEWGLIAWFPGLHKKRPQEKVSESEEPKEPRSEYHQFIAEKMSKGMSMKDAAAEWRKERGE